MRIEVEAGATPAILLTRVRASLKGLHTIELWQKAGRSGYRKLPGVIRLELYGERIEPGDNPSESAEEIVDGVIAYAEQWREEEKGESTFKALLHHSREGKPVETEVKFDVAHELGDGSKAKDGDTQSAIMREQALYCKQLHNCNIALWKSSEAIFRSIAHVVNIPAEMMPRILTLRMEAFEDRAAALSEGMVDQKGSDKWRDTLSSLQTTLDSEVGRAATARLMGLEGDAALAYIQGGGKLGGLRGALKKFGLSLSKEQREKLKALDAADFTNRALEAAAASSDDEACSLLAPVLRELDESVVTSLDELLEEKQRELLDEIMTLVTAWVEKQSKD